MTLRTQATDESEQVALGTSTLNHLDPQIRVSRDVGPGCVPSCSLEEGPLFPTCPSRPTGCLMPGLSSAHPPESFGAA